MARGGCRRDVARPETDGTGDVHPQGIGVPGEDVPGPPVRRGTTWRSTGRSNPPGRMDAPPDAAARPEGLHVPWPVRRHPDRRKSLASTKKRYIEAALTPQGGRFVPSSVQGNRHSSKGNMSKNRDAFDKFIDQDWFNEWMIVDNTGSRRRHPPEGRDRRTRGRRRDRRREVPAETADALWGTKAPPNRPPRRCPPRSSGRTNRSRSSGSPKAHGKKFAPACGSNTTLAAGAPSTNATGSPTRTPSSQVRGEVREQPVRMGQPQRHPSHLGHEGRQAREGEDVGGRRDERR